MLPEEVRKEYGEFHDFVGGLNEKQPFYDRVFDFSIKDRSGNYHSDKKD